jgi:hypothetical protein
MEEKFLPKIQILLSILFGLFVLFAPFVVRSLEGILFLAAAAGFGLGVITMRLGWVILIQKRTVRYPFAEWSLAVLKLIYGPQVINRLAACRRAEERRLVN